MRLDLKVDEYRRDPALFVREMLNVEPRPHQEEVMMAVARGERRISMRSGRRVGKTSLIAWLSMWWEMMYADAKTIVTAPSSAQLQDAYVPEFNKWVNQLPQAARECWDTRQERFVWKIPGAKWENFITVRTARKDSPESLHGINAPHVAVFVDEASGVGDEHFQALSGSLGTDHSVLVLTGNPSRQSGYFYMTHNEMRDRWHTVHVNSEEVPSVSRDWIEEMREFYGENSDGYRVHVLGEFPTGASNTVIPIDLINAAMEYELEYEPSHDIVWGVDVARFGDDKTAIAKRQGRLVPEPVRLYAKFDLMEIVGFIKNEWDTTPSHMRPFEIMVDAIGLGAGVADRLRELNLPARDVNVSELSPFKGGNYYRLRDELWFQMKTWFSARDVSMPKDSLLATQLSEVTYGYASNGKLKVASKDELRRMGIRSPDAAEALMMTFAGSAAVGQHGKRKRTKQRRRIRGLV